MEAQRDALNSELATKRDEREAYATATKFLELQPHLVAEHEKLEKAIADKELTLKKLYEQLQDAEKKTEELKKIAGEIMANEETVSVYPVLAGVLPDDGTLADDICNRAGNCLFRREIQGRRDC